MAQRLLGRFQSSAWLVWSALLIVYVVWGSTYLAIAVVVKSMPPFASAGIRFVVAGLIMAAVIAAIRGPRHLAMTRHQLVAAGLVGLALLLGGNGLVMVAERTVPSGLAALIIAVVPLFIVLLRVVNRERVRRGTLGGVLVGFAGVGLLVGSRGLTGEVDMLGMLLLIAASLSWAIGSYYSRRMPIPADPFVSSTAQQLVAGAVLLAVAAGAGDLGAFSLGSFAPESILALAYLIVFGSVIAFSAYTWLLANAPVSKVATYAYVNPVVAIFLGWLILAESVTPAMVVGGLLVVLGVALVIRTEGRRPQRLAAVEMPAATVSRTRGASQQDHARAR